jgi:hypothetical protein
VFHYKLWKHVLDMSVVDCILNVRLVEKGYKCWLTIVPHRCFELLIKLQIQKIVVILYINSVSLSVNVFVEVLKPRSLLIKLSPRTRRPKNYLRPQVLTSYFYFYIRFRAATAGGPYFLLLLLRSFLRSNCRRRWGRYFWDLEGG